MQKNILVDFLKKVLISTFLLILVSSISIYYIKKKNLDAKLVTHIEKHLDLCKNSQQQCFNKESGLMSSNFIKHIKMIDFSFFSIYNQNGKQLYTFMPSNITINEKKIFQEYSKNIELKMGGKSTIRYDFFRNIEGEYYISILYPIEIQKSLEGFIIAYKNIDKSIIHDFERDIFHVIITVIISILIFSMVIFPLIFNAYKKLKESEKKLLLNNIETIHTLGNAIALRDSDTNEHNYRVTIYAVAFARALHVKHTAIQKLIIGSFLHDVGKIGISDTILLKNSKLTDEEFTLMKEHVGKGIALIKDNEWLENAKDVIAYHHEKYDGSGYPHGIEAENIPLIARIFSIIDVFDALTSKRPYKEAFTYEESIAILKKEEGTHFDSKLLKTFILISHSLYFKTSRMSPQQLKDELNNIINDYFLENVIL